MKAHELRAEMARLNAEHDAELDKFEKETRFKYRQQRRALLEKAGLDVCIQAECEEAFYEFWPPKVEDGDDGPAVSYGDDQ